MRNGAKSWFALSLSTFIWMSLSVSVGSDFLRCDHQIQYMDPRTRTNCTGTMIYFHSADNVVSIDCNGSDLNLTQVSECSKTTPRFPSHLKTLQLKNCAVLSSLQCAGWESSSIRKLCLVQHPTPVLDAMEGLSGLVDLYIYNSDNVKAVPVESLQLLPSLRRLRLDADGLTELPAHLFSDAKRSTGKGQNLTFLEIALNNITSLPADVFFGLQKLDKLSICRNQMQHVDVNAFRGLGSLHHLEFTGEYITLPPQIFGHTPQLSTLIIDKNRVKLTLDEGVVSTLTLLEVLNISDTKKLVLGPKALSNLTSLRTLDLSRSGITELPEDLLLGSNAITSLDLRDNSLSNLPATVFSGLTKLENLRISNNLLETINESLFASLTEIKEIYLDQNLIRTLPDFQFSSSKLNTISLARNLIDVDISKHIFSNASSLTSLDLSLNLLSWECWVKINGVNKILLRSPLEHLVKLTSLNLSNNQIRSICYDWKFQMTNLKKLDLSSNTLEMLSSMDLYFQSGNLQVNLRNNSITTIAKDLNKTPTIYGKNKFKLGDNPFNCDCKLHNFLKTLNKDTFDLTDAQCRQPLALERVTLLDMADHKLDSLTCSINGTDTCKCLFRPNKLIIECICENTVNLTLPESPLNETVALKLRLLNPQPDLTGLPKNVTRIDLSGLKLKSIPNISDTVQELDLRNNSLEVVPLEILKKNITLILVENSLQCDCWGTENVRNLRKYQQKIRNYTDLLCSDGFTVKDKDPDSLCDVYYATWIGGSLIVAGILIAIAIILMYKFLPQVQVVLFNCGCKCLVDEEWLDSGKKFDIFLSYTMKAVEDRHFVTNILLPKLEELKYKVCEHTKDFLIGHKIPDQIYTAVASSKRTLFVISNTFIHDSVWVLEEFNATILQGVRDKRNRAVVIILGDLDLSTAPIAIKRHLDLNTYIKWDPADETFWKRLQNALPKKMTAKEIKKRQNAVKAVKALGTGRNVVINDDGRLVIAADLKHEVNVTLDPMQVAVNKEIDC